MALSLAKHQSSTQEVGHATDFIADGQLNRWFGWTTLLIGVALSSWLDPWLFSVADNAEFNAENLSAWRHSQGVMIAMGLLQLAMSSLLSIRCFSTGARAVAGCLTAAGATAYSAGYALGSFWPSLQHLILVGSLANLAGFALLWRSGPAGQHAAMIRIVLPVACLGMFLDFTSGTLQLMPPLVVSQFFGDANDVPLRMLRLARVAAIALPVLTLLYYGLVSQGHLAMTLRERNITTWGGWSLAAGAVGMPALLTLAGCASLSLKYLLPMPATAVTLGVIVATWTSWRRGPGLERFGWTMVLASLSAGLMMGLFAFDGPLPTPAFLGEYNAGARRLVRLAHSYAIVFGMASIFLARAIPPGRRLLRRVGVSVFRIGCLTTLVAMCMSASLIEETWILGCGPVLVVVGCLACLVTMASDVRPQPASPRQR